MVNGFSDVVSLVVATLVDLLGNCYYVSLIISIAILVTITSSVIYWLLGR